MTCYNLVNNILKPVRYIRLNGRMISNPPDSLVIENELGYPLEETAPPEYDSEKEYVNKSWEMRDGIIFAVWTVHQIELPPEESTESESVPESNSEEINND